MASFKYVNLISTDTTNFPDNTNSSFGNSLADALDFPPNTHVALQEISFVPCFYNIEPKNNDLMMFLRQLPARVDPENPPPHKLWGQWAQVRLIPGYYPTIDDLLKMINKCIQGMENALKDLKDAKVFSYDPVSMKIKYDFDKLVFSLAIRGALLNLLGAEAEKNITNRREWAVIGYGKDKLFYEVPVDPHKPDGPKEKRYYADSRLSWPASLKDSFAYVAQLRTFNSIYIFTDLTESQVFGSTYADILRTISINKIQKHAEIVYECENLHFLKLKKRFIKTIQVLIRDMHGNPMLFRQGSVRLKLVFRIPSQ